MRLRLLFPALALLFLCNVVHADDITSDVQFDLTYQGPGSETIDFSSVFDRTTQSVLPGSTISSTGTLGAFGFNGFTVSSNPNNFGGTSFLYDFLFSNQTGDSFVFEVLNIISPAINHWVDTESLTGPDVSGYSLVVPPTQIGAFLDPVADPVATTPEPSTWLLLFTGIAAIGLVCWKRRIISP